MIVDETIKISPSSQSNSETKKNTLNYFGLMQPLNTHGRYQYLLYIMGLYIFLMNTLTTFNIPYIFMNPQFDCLKQGIKVENCEKYVCNNLSTSQIQNFPIIKKYSTLATEFGPFYCGDNYKLGLYRGIFFIGEIIGLIVVVMFSDNYGRKQSLLISQAFICIGFLFFILSPNLPIALISLFFVGIGTYSPLRIIQVIMSETTNRKLLRKFFSTILIAYSIGEMLIGTLFSITKQWRSFTLYFNLIPCLFLFILTYFIVQETPKYLLRKGQEQAINDFNKIASINKVDFRYKAGDLDNQIKLQKQYLQIKQKITPLDIFKYSSLRVPTICFCFIFLGADFLLYAFSSMSNNIGFNPVLNGYFMGISMLLAIPAAFLVCNYIPRKRSGQITYVTIVVLSFIQIFIKRPSSCQFCSEAIWQIILIMISAFCSQFQTLIIFQQLAQFYPTSIKMVGMGIPTIVGSIGLFLSQYLIVGAIQKYGTAFPIVICVMMLGAVSFWFIPQTLNTEMKQQIQQVKQQRQMKNQFISNKNQ